jgi:hypothetical protein
VLPERVERRQVPDVHASVARNAAPCRTVLPFESEQLVHSDKIFTITSYHLKCRTMIINCDE